MSGLVLLLLTFLLMWLLLVRPQQKRVRQHQQVVASLEVGDDVVTAGGLYGTVTAVDEEAMSLLVAPGVEVRVLRGAVSQRVAPLAGSDDAPGDEQS